MSTARLFLLTTIVSGGVSAATTWGFLHYEHRGTPTSTISSERSEENSDESADFTPDDLKKMLADFAIYPEDDADASNPPYTDRAIADMSSDATDAFIRQAVNFLKGSPERTAEQCFGLGRVALLHHYPQVARDYLLEASSKGSAAAWGFLGDSQITANAEQQWHNYAKAAELGFAPARAWKAAVELDAIAAIERFTADNADPQLPEDVHGISNFRLMAWNSAEIDALIEDYGFFAEQTESKGYLAYGLGRAAYFHQQITTARKYFQIAEKKGSVAAMTYLAYEEFTTDLDKQIELLKKGAAGGFVLAKRRLEDALEHKARISASRQNGQK